MPRHKPSSTNEELRAAVRSGGVVYVAGDELRAIDVETGQVKWAASDALPPGLVKLALSGSSVVACGNDSNSASLLSYDQETGTLRWSQPLEVAAETIPGGRAVAVMGETVLGSASAVAQAFRSSDGVSLWRFGTDPGGTPSFAPRPAQGEVVFSDGLTAHLLDLATGNEKSALECDDCTLLGSLADGRVLASAFRRKMVILDFTNQSVTVNPTEMRPEALLPNDRILATLTDTSYYAGYYVRMLIDPSGREAWRHLIDGDFMGIEGDVALFTDGTLHAYDLATGLTRWGYGGRGGGYIVTHAVALAPGAAVWTALGDLLILDTSKAAPGAGACAPCAPFCASQSDRQRCDAAGDGVGDQAGKLGWQPCFSQQVCDDGACRLRSDPSPTPVATQYYCNCTCTCELCIAVAEGVYLYPDSTCTAICPQTCASGTSTCGAWQGLATGTCVPAP